MAEPEILTRFHPAGAVGIITLNRASKLNALNINMIRLLHEAVDKVDRLKGKLGCVILDSAGNRAFCAGGDVAEVRAEALNGGSLPADFFFEEYALVYRLATLFDRTGCCQVSIWNGITMGGGVGLSTHGPIRVATEKTIFAKPEMAIGLFPDVGSLHKLARLSVGPNAGLFLAISGQRLQAWDCLRAGLATHFVPSERLPELHRRLIEKVSIGMSRSAALAACDAAVVEVAAGAMPSDKGAVLTDENLQVINRCFSAPTLEEIVARLAAEPGDFAAATLQSMRVSCSPTSCKVTLRAIREFAAEGFTIGRALEVDYRLVQRFVTRPQPLSDFYEGVRAVLLDKSRKQQWRPSWDELDQIGDEAVSMFFSPLEADHRRGELHLRTETAFSESERAPFSDVILRAKL